MGRKREFELKQGRFKDLVLYISAALADDPTFGSTKLNKILYFSDFEAYKFLGQPITGAEYQKNKYGPTAREYLPLVRELEDSRFIDVVRKQVVDHLQDVVVPTGAVLPNMKQFSADEIALVDRVIEEFRAYTNTEASDRSHERSAGWLARDLGETIPYSSALINPEPLDEAALVGLKTKVPV
jgi:Antitoxin SocA-like, Panacea domain